MCGEMYMKHLGINIENKMKIAIMIIVVILVCVGSYWFYFVKDYESRTMTVKGWNFIQLGFNIFPENENEKTLFLHGGDWYLKEFLEKQEALFLLQNLQPIVLHDSDNVSPLLHKPI